MSDPLNVTVLMLLLCTWAGIAGLLYSNDLMDNAAIRLRARARARRAAARYYQIAYDESIREDIARDRERSEMADLLRAEYRALAEERKERM